MRILALLVAAAAFGCAGADRHVAAPTAQARAHTPYALDAIVVTAPRAGELSASREWTRAGSANRAVARADVAGLQESFARDLGAVLPLDANAPLRLRVTLTPQSPGYYEGLAAETSDVTLSAEVVDGAGNVVRTITLREPASAPLQRSASRQQRFDAAVDRLARRLAAEL